MLVHYKNHARIIQQFEQWKNDLNLSLHIQVVKENWDRLAYYLAHDGVVNMIHLVIFRRLSGRVKEHWMVDMGLGACHGGFEAMSENEYEDMLLEEEEETNMEADVMEISDEGDEDDVGGDVNLVTFDLHSRG